MTEIYLHGILAKEFGEKIKMKIRSIKDVVRAIDVNKPLFQNRIIDLDKQGLQYAVIVDGKNIQTLEQVFLKKEPKVIELVPLICGRGPLLFIGLGAGSLIAGAMGGFTLLGIAFSASFLTSLGVTLLGIGIQMMLTQNQSSATQTEGIESSVSAIKQSFNFSSKANLTEQGVPVPVGYGRLRVGSYVIQSTIRNYPVTYEVSSAYIEKIPLKEMNTVFRS